jgi:hypothetical protein
VGEPIRTETHGVGKGKVQMCWNVFLDDASLLKFQSAQKALQSKRLAEEGAPGYVDSNSTSGVELTLFWEASDIARGLVAGKKVRLAPAGVDRKPTGAPLSATVTAARMQGNLGKVSVKLDGEARGLDAGALARLWAE